eukprot:gene6351-4577_t
MDGGAEEQPSGPREEEEEEEGGRGETVYFSLIYFCSSLYVALGYTSSTVFGKEKVSSILRFPVVGGGIHSAKGKKEEKGKGERKQGTCPWVAPAHLFILFYCGAGFVLLHYPTCR